MNVLSSAGTTARAAGSTFGDMEWLLHAGAAMADCRTEIELLRLAHSLLTTERGLRRVGLAVVDPVHSQMICKVVSDAADRTVMPAGMARSFEPGSQLRTLLYGVERGAGDWAPEHARCVELEGCWPFNDVACSTRWIALRMGQEIIGSIVVADPPAGSAVPPGEMLLVMAFADALALNIQTLRLRTERAARIDELDGGLRRLTDELVWLRTTSSLMAACRNVTEVVHLTYGAVRRGLDFDRVGIFLVREEDGRQRAYEMAGTDAAGAHVADERPDAYLDDPELAIHSPDFAWLLAGNAYYYCADRWFITVPEDRSRLDGPIREQIVVAIRRGEHVLGFLSVDNALSGRPLPESRADVLVTFAQQVSTALENAWLTEAEARARMRAEALLRAGQAMNGSLDLDEVMQVVAREALQALQGRTCEIYLYDEGCERTVASFSEGLTADELARLWDPGIAGLSPRAIKAEREMLECLGPVLIDNDVTPPLNLQLSRYTGITARVLVPLLVEREGERAALGAFYVSYSGKRPAAITSEEVGLAGALAAQAATALEKARLYAAERERVSRLEELDRLRREFLATVTHELRTPLTGIIGFAETLLHFWSRMSEERRQSSVQKIVQSAGRLDRLVRDLLLASRIDEARLSVTLSEVQLGDALRHAIDEMHAKYPAQRITLQSARDGLTVAADAERLTQILVNLLDNAIKYSAENAPVSVGIDVLSDRVHVWVRDQGTGLNHAQLVRLFERFSKLGNPARTGQGGTGLGLYISRHLARAMGGDILVESMVGVGSTFTLELNAIPQADSTA